MPQVLCQQHSIAQVEAIIFDKDGTLADSRGFLTRLAKLRAEGIAEAVMPILGDRRLEAQLLEIFGLTPAGLNPDGLMAAETRQANQRATVDCLVKAGYPAELSPRLVAQVFTQVDTQLAEKVEYTPPFVGTETLLRRLGQSSLKIGLLSSDSTPQVKKFLDHYGLANWFQAWRGTEPEDVPKPEPDLLYGLCDRLQVKVSRTIVVGDSWVDLSLAQKAGAAAFLSVSEAWGRAPVTGATLVLRHWDDLDLTVW